MAYPERACSWIQRKEEVLAKSKFCICFENSAPFNLWDSPWQGMGQMAFAQKVREGEAWCDGYASEKIYHCLLNGAIPIYWGCPNIEDFVPKSCFIDYRDFECEPERLYEYLIAMPDDEYFSYRESIRRYLSSELFYLVGHPRPFHDMLVSEIIVNVRPSTPYAGGAGRSEVAGWKQQILKYGTQAASAMSEGGALLAAKSGTGWCRLTGVAA